VLIGLGAAVLELGEAVHVPILVVRVDVCKEVFLGLSLTFEPDLFRSGSFFSFSRLDTTPGVERFQEFLVRLCLIKVAFC